MGEDIVPLPQPWERMPKEGARAWEAFTVYRDAGASRTLAYVASELGKSKALMEKWSRQHNWVDRCAAWDREVDRRRRERDEEARAEMEERHRAMGRGLSTLVLEWLVGNPQENIPAASAAQLNPDTAERFAKAAVMIERLTAGLHTDLTKASYSIDSREAAKMISGVVEIALNFVPFDDQEAFMREIQAFGSSL